MTGGADRELDTALVRLHSAESRALRVLHDAELSLVVFEEHLVRAKTHLRTLGYVLL